jgi:hypothetical protein
VRNTVSWIVAVTSLTPWPFARIVIGAPPAGAAALTISVSTDAVTPSGSRAGLSVEVTPVGRPSVVRSTGPVNDTFRVMVIVVGLLEVPAATVSVDCDTEIAIDGGGGGSVMVTVAVPRFVVSAVDFAVIVTVPTATPVTIAPSPLGATVARVTSELAHVTVLAAPFSTETFTDSPTDLPISTEAVPGVTVTDTTRPGSRTTMPLPPPHADTPTSATTKP